MRTLQLLGFAVAMLVVQSVYAHHAFDNEFDRTKPVTLTGTVTKVDWVAPHVMLYLDVKGTPHAGQWAVEMGDPQQLTAKGWTQTSVRRGGEVTVEGWLAKDGSKRANAKSVAIKLSAASSYNGSPE